MKIMSKKRTMSGSIALTKLIHVPFEMKGKNDKMVKGIFIPIEPNCLVTGKEKNGATPLYLPLSMVFNDERDENGQDGFFSQQGNVKWKDATEEQKEKFKNLPILGNFIDWSKGGSKDENSGAASKEVYTPDSDDLPF